MNKVTTSVRLLVVVWVVVGGIGLMFVPTMIDQTFSILHNIVNLSFHMWNMIQI